LLKMDLYFLAYKKNSLVATAIKSEYERLLKNKDYSLPENGKRYWFRGKHVVFEAYTAPETKVEVTESANESELINEKAKSNKKKDLLNENIDDNEKLDE